jgi:hypothetical protein
MVWVLAFEISLALIIGFVVLRSVGRRKIFAVTQQPSQSDLIDAGGRARYNSQTGKWEKTYRGTALRSILAFALICAATIQASAQYPNGFRVDGNELMTWCEPRNAAGPSNPMCIGFVAGVSDAVNFSRQFTGQGSNTSCTPPGVTIGQEADVVVNYVNRNPDKRDLAAAALVVAAIDEAWCSQAPASPSVHYHPR